MIEAHVWRVMETKSLSRGYITLANTHLASNIMAALALGDMAFIGVDIDWVAGLLSNHRLPVHLLRDYLGVYHQAARSNLDDRGKPVVDWLAQMSGEGD